jgi:UDP-N-acetyl-D-glucosamine dehydrogenase
MLKAGRFEATTDESALGRRDARFHRVRRPQQDALSGHAVRQSATEAIARTAQACRRPRNTAMSGHHARGHAAQARRARPNGRKGRVPGLQPERAGPGTLKYHTKNTPKARGITAACTGWAVALYSSCIDTVVPVSKTEPRSCSFCSRIHSAP